MASLKFPLSVQLKQQVLYLKPSSAAELSAWGKQYESQGLLHDALEFYQVANDKSAIESLAGRAVQVADLVLYLNARKALGQEPDSEKLRALQAGASTAGFESVAKRTATLIASRT